MHTNITYLGSSCKKKQLQPVSKRNGNQRRMDSRIIAFRNLKTYIYTSINHCMKLVFSLLLILFIQNAKCQKISFSTLLSFYNNPNEKEMKTYAKKIGYSIDEPTKTKGGNSFDEFIYCHYMDSKLGKAAYEFFINKKKGVFCGITYSTIHSSDWQELATDITSNGFSIELEQNTTTYYSLGSTVISLSHDTLSAKQKKYVRYILVIFKKQSQNAESTQSNPEKISINKVLKFRTARAALLDSIDADVIDKATWEKISWLVVFDTLHATIKIYSDPVQEFDIVRKVESNKLSVASWVSFNAVDEKGKERLLIWITPNKPSETEVGTLIVQTNGKWIAYELQNNE